MKGLLKEIKEIAEEVIQHSERVLEKEVSYDASSCINLRVGLKYSRIRVERIWDLIKKEEDIA